MVAIHTGVRLACFAGLVHLVVIHLDLLLFLDLGKSTEKNLLMIRWNLTGPSQEAVSNKLELFELPSSVLKVFWFTLPENSKLKVQNCKDEKFQPGSSLLLLMLGPIVEMILLLSLKFSH